MNNSMGQKLERRLEVLRAEYKAGLDQQDALQRRLQELKETMLRIAGAIRVLEETLAEEAASD